MVEHLYILEDKLPRSQSWKNTQWLELLHLFTAVKNLYLSWEIVPSIVPILQELVEERLTEVLPNMQSIFLEDLEESRLVPETIRHFVTARQLSHCPIAISYWTRRDDKSSTW